MSAMEGCRLFGFTILLLICVTVSLCSHASLLLPLDDSEEKGGNRAAEDYMRTLYQQMTDENGELRSSNGFTSVSCFTGAVVHALEAEEKCMNIAQFSFNLDSLANIQPINNALQKGLLRVYMQMESIDRADIEIFARILDSKTVSVLVGTHQVTATKELNEWIEIPVTDGLQTLFSSKPHLNRLEVSLQVNKLDCKGQQINAAIRFINPLLVLFMDIDEKFSVDEVHRKEPFKRQTDPAESGFGEVTPEEPVCQHHPFILNFELTSSFVRTLFRDVIVIAPPYVNIGYCSGSCVQLTTRGALLTIQQEPCCSPILGPLDVLLRQSNGAFQIKRIPNVIATSCGCHI